MKLTRDRLSKIIQEELQKIIQEENLEELNFKQMGQNLKTGVQAMGSAFKPSNVTSGFAQGLGGKAGELAAGADALVRGQGKDQVKQNMANKAIANQREALSAAISSLVKSNAPGAKELNVFFQQWFRKFPNQSSSYSGPMTEQDQSSQQQVTGRAAVTKNHIFMVANSNPNLKDDQEFNKLIQNLRKPEVPSELDYLIFTDGSGKIGNQNISKNLVNTLKTVGIYAGNF